MAIGIPEVTITIKSGDNIWDLLKSNQDGLRYTESELDANTELFVYILYINALDNFRNMVPPKDIKLPRHESLADVVVNVRSDSTTFPKKFFEWVEMDRCAGRS